MNSEFNNISNVIHKKLGLKTQNYNENMQKQDINNNLNIIITATKYNDLIANINLS